MLPADITGSPARYHVSFSAVTRGGGVGCRLTCAKATVDISAPTMLQKIRRAGRFMTRSEVLQSSIMPNRLQRQYAVSRLGEVPSFSSNTGTSPAMNSRGGRRGHTAQLQTHRPFV